METDQILGKISLTKLLLLRLLRTSCVFPLDDKFVSGTVSELQVVLNYTGIPQCFPHPNHVWPEFQSDEALSRLFFFGVGAMYMADAVENDAIHGPFVADFKDLTDLKVRDGFVGYGHHVHFNSEQMPTAIYDFHRETLVTPADDTWQHTKFALRQALGMESTGVKHLLDVHFLCANSVCTSAALHLSSYHPLSRILAVFTFRTAAVNMSALESLLPEFSLFHRQIALEYTSVQQLLVDGIERSTIWCPFPARRVGAQLRALSEQGKFPLHRHGVALRSVTPMMRRLLQTWN